MAVRLCLLSIVCAGWLTLAPGCTNADSEAIHYGYTGSRPAQCAACD